MKIRVTVDLDDKDCTEARDNMGSVESGVYGIDNDGLYHMYYGNKAYLCEFKDVEILK